MNATKATFQVGQMISDAEVVAISDATPTGGFNRPIIDEGGGWFRAGSQRVYICWGCHRDGQFGWQVKEIR